MANYYGMTRSNYFRVTDPERLKKIIAATCMDEDSLELWSCESENGPLYAFGGYGSICGLMPSFDHKAEDGPDNEKSGPEDDENEPDFDAFEEELRKIVAPDDAIIITEIGYEKLRYLTAYSIVITAKHSECVDLRESCIDTAQRLLGNPNWDTRMEY